MTRRLIIFIKALVKGSVKTRLASQIGDDLALEAYQAMTADLTANLKEYEPLTLYFVDDPAGASLLKSPVSGDRIRRQAGHDLGEKMSNAFADVFREQVDLAVLIGSDIPYLDSSLIGEFFSKLMEYPLVLGPARDGGYYLIGFQRQLFTPRVFQNIAWSTATVFKETLQRAKESTLRVYSGKMLVDIDTLEELRSVLSDGALQKSMPRLMGVFEEIQEQTPGLPGVD